MLPQPVRPKSEVNARAKLSDMVAATVFPTLSAEQLTRLLRESRRIDQYGWLPSWDDNIEWRAGAYEVDDIVVPVTRNGHVYIVSVAGTAVTEPDWPLEAQGTVTQDGVEYTEVTDFLTVWYGAWDLNRAAAEGWRIKAGLVSNRHDFANNSGNYNPAQVFDHCMKMADHYNSKQIAAITLASGRWNGTGRIPGAHLEDAK
jgi:hypothetical protein